MREFVQRKTKTQFRRYASETDSAVIAQVWNQAKKDIDVTRRQALVYSLYGSKQKSVMDIPMVKVLQKQAEGAPYAEV